MILVFKQKKGIAMKKILLNLSIVSVLILLTGCATVLSGTKQTITFESSPSGASLYLDGEKVGVTPFTDKLKKNKYSSFRIELDGYETISRSIGKDVDLVALLSIFWDLGTTDLATGSAWKYDRNSYYIELQKKK